MLYGGTERVVGCVTDELVRWGHQVTLFASGDSKTRRRPGPRERRESMTANLPPPEEEKEVKSAIGAARAKVARKESL